MSLLQQALAKAPAPFFVVVPKAKAKAEAKAKAKGKSAPGQVKRRARIDLDNEADAARAIAKQANKVLRAKMVDAKSKQKRLLIRNQITNAPDLAWKAPGSK